MDAVIGVDTHRDTLTAAAVTPVGGLLEQVAVAADTAGYQRLLDFARAQVPDCRCFAVEGAGSYGAGLARLLADQGEWVVEVDQPRRPARRGGKTDALDAVRAAREVLAQEHLASPRRRGDRQALRGLLATGNPATSAQKVLKVGAVKQPRKQASRSAGMPADPPIAYPSCQAEGQLQAPAGG